MNLDPSSLSSFVLISTAFSAAFVAALWLSLLFWTYRDIRKRIRDPLINILAVLIVAVLFLPGLLIYLILRPQKTLGEEYQETLEEEAILQSLENDNNCQGCGKPIETKWIICPFCHQSLKNKCQNCNNLIKPEWDICPYCGKSVKENDLAIGDSMVSLTMDHPSDPEQ